MAGSHEGRVAVVTGGANSIGKAICERLARDGAAVAIADIADASATLANIEQAGSRGFAQRCDVSSAAAINDFAEAATKALGSCDILIHNAGIYPHQPFEEISFKDWRRVMDLNLDAMFHLLKAFLPGMQAGGWGRVVGMISNTVFLGMPNLSHYQASKAALVGLTRGLSAEYGDSGITFNTLAPTLTRTQGATNEFGGDDPIFGIVEGMQSIKRGGRPEDLVGAVSFMTSDDAAFMTGQSMVVDGGLARV